MANVYVERDRRGGLREPPSRAMSSRTTSTAFSAVSLPNRTQLSGKEARASSFGGACPAFKRQEEPRPLANRLGLFCIPLTLSPHLVRWFVLPQPDVDRVAKQSVGSPGQIRDFGHKPRLDPVHARQNKRRSEAGLPRW
jgi:hypothetical protein